MKGVKYKTIFFSLIQSCGKEMLWYIFTMIFVAFLGPLSLLFRGRILDAIVSEEGKLLWEMLCFGAIAFLIVIMSYGNSVGKQRMRRKLYGEFSEKVLDKFSRIRYSIYESEQTINIIKRVGDAPQEHILEYFSSFLTVCSEITRAVCYAVVFVRLSLWCVLLGVVSFEIMLFFDWKRIYLMRELYEEQTRDERLMESYEQILENKNTLYDLRVARAVSYLLNKRKVLSDSIVRERYQRTIRSQCAYFYGEMAMVLWMAIVLMFSVNAFLKGTITLGLFTALIGSLQQIIGSFRILGESYSELRRRSDFVEYYIEFMNLDEAAEIKAEISDKNEAGIRFEHVTFTYPGQTRPALYDVSFVMTPETRLALVGHNGSGKSTLIKLMCGLYQPDSGKIFVNGYDITNLAPAVLRRCYSVIFQDYGKYFFTIQENVELGDVEKKCAVVNREQEVRVALRQGLADDLAGRLGQTLGNLSADGIELSGGQWQRLALSRACYRDSDFLVLDEPTASLDPVAENELYANFTEMMKARSCILISHRLAVARYTNRILVLQGGVLIEEGDHDSLMKKNGVYASMYHAQSHWYAQDNMSDV